jgi:hypothetical protein
MNSQIFKQLYFTALPLFSIYSTTLGIHTGINLNTRKKENIPFDYYANIIGYTGLGIITGITYPISYPLLTGYIFYKADKLV